MIVITGVRTVSYTHLSLYGTPLESTTYKFSRCLQERFGIIPGVTDKNYITNSYHIHVTEEIDAFDKLSFEAQFQELSPGGAISYVEVPNMQNNIDAVLAVMKHIYDNIMYAELNTKSDYCQCCGYEGEIQIISDEHGKLIWECPNCGNQDQAKMNVARRTCGYIGTQFWNCLLYTSVPKDLKEQFPADERIVKIKQERDPEIRRIFEGKSDKLLLIIGPCSADREDAVLDYVTRLSKVHEKVKDKIMIIPRIYTNKPRTTGGCLLYTSRCV